MENEFCWDGTLSARDFETSAKNLIDRWASCSATSHQEWKWENSTRFSFGALNNANGYLSLEDVRKQKTRKQDSVDDCLPESEEAAEFSDPATLVQSLNDETHIYIFNIIYNYSYRVPMLFFRGYFLDGRLVELEDIKKGLPEYSCQTLKELKWTFITQEEHPYLNEPWYCLHPCGTSEWMCFLFSGDLSSWYSENVKHVVESEVNIEQNQHERKTGFLNRTTSYSYVKKTNNSNFMDFVCKQYLVSWLSIIGQVVGLKVPYEISQLKC